MESAFADFDLSDFWEESDYATKAYVSSPLTDALIASIEQELGYILPASYIELMKQQNGGIPKRCCFPTTERTTWAEDHVALSGIFGIEREKAYTLCGNLGSQFMIDQWEYPNIGVYFANCPSAGHDMICFDYRKNGRAGEPEIVHVDQEDAYKITFLAPDFAAFIKGLVDDSEFA
jgi:SMI1-KNR4 cell-wall